MKIPANFTRTSWLKIAALASMMAVTVTFHYHGMNQEDPILRGVFRQFCYIPIVLAALWFGLRGGLLAAGLIVAVVVPHLIRMPEMAGEILAQEGLEYFYYFLFGGLFGFLSDRERHAQRKREELVREVARMEHLSALGELAAGLAHEIKNPMGSIKGAAEILAPEIPADHPKREFVVILLEEVDRLNRVVEDFLNYARPIRLTPKSIPLRPLIEQVITQLHLADAAASAIVADIPPDLAVWGDDEKLRQVFINLAGNALEAMKGSGRLRIHAAREREGRVVIDFHDQGPGVPVEQRRRTFIPFITDKERGTGLGLTISERIVAAHGGGIEADASPDGGAVFRVTLPGEAP